MEPTVAIASTDPNLAPELCERLTADNCRVLLVTSAGRLAERVRETDVHVAVLDLDLAGPEYRHLLEDLRKLNRHLGLIAVTARCSEDDEVYLRSNGVSYVAFKPAEPGRLAQIVNESARSAARKRYF